MKSGPSPMRASGKTHEKSQRDAVEAARAKSGGSKEAPTVTLNHPRKAAPPAGELSIDPLFGQEGDRIPRHELPGDEMSPDVAYQIVHDELMLDGNARLNVATFVSTWMEPQAQKLMSECFDKNMIDKDEYPQTAELESRCVNMLSRLWNAPDASTATGCSTTGSSEAAMLGGLALKRRWRQRCDAAGQSADRPNLVMGINVQVCWEKLANYWDVEMRLVPMEGDRFHLSAEEAVKLCDENTIGVVAILGSTFDGSYEPVQEICDALDRLQQETGVDVPVHVDGASGAFVAPFIDPDLVWDFRLPRVASINASGHKYGLVYPGVGWIVWRDADALPEDLIFWVNYLGDNMPTFALNFSRPGAQVVGQYYNFLRLGFDGYRKVQGYARDVATGLSSQIAELGPFELLTRGDELPVFAFTLRGDVDNYTVFDVSNALRERGWQVPAYTFPENRENLAALRVVVRRGFTHDLADLLVADIRRQLPRLERQPVPVHDASTATAFAH
jgi:glutamate decarboxylase